MSGGTDLAELLATMEPVCRPGEFVFTTVTNRPAGVEVLTSVLVPIGRLDDALSVLRQLAATAGRSPVRSGASSQPGSSARG